MGLEFIDITFRIEKSFGVTISNSDWEDIRTIGDLSNWLNERVVEGEAPWASFPADWKTIQTLTAETAKTADEPLRNIRPRDRVIHRLSFRQRKKLWRLLPKYIPDEIKRLQRPSWLKLGLIVSALGIAGTLIGGGGRQLGAGGIGLGLFASVMSALVLHYATRWLRSHPGPGWETFGNLARRIGGRPTLTSEMRHASPEQVLKEVRRILSDALGLEIEELQNEARLIEDLGCG